MSTALLQEQQLPAFETYSVSDFRPALEALMSQFNNLLEKVCAQQESSWDETVAPLSDLSRKIDHVWSIASHLKAVADSEELRAVYKTLSEELSAFYSAVAQNKELYSRYLAVSEQSGLNASQKKVLENKLRSFRLSGVALEDDAKAEFKALNQKLVGLSNRFSENVLDSSQAWSLHIVDAERLAGVPSSVITRLEERARDKGYETGYLLGLDLTLYLPVMQYCEDRDLRKVLYEAFITRASNQGPHDLSHANEELMRDIMDARLRKSELLDLASYADLSVQTKMAESPQQVLDFLYDLHEKAKPLAEKEFVELTDYAKQKFGLAELAAWDVPFVTETLRKERFDVDQELLRQYFPLPTVLSGLFEVLKRVFGVELEEQEGVSTPVPDARCFKVLQNGQALAYIYMDLYSRDGKRGGAWVGTCHKLTEFDKEEPLLPVAYLVCNFAAPSDGKPSLLTHSDVVTLFHECGHAMHHCLTKISYPEISGIAGVPWDAVELPSQFLENWCWQPEALEFLSSHVDDKESLPDALIEKMMKAKSFMAGMQTVRQLEFGLFDFCLHHEYQKDKTDIQGLLERTQADISVVPVPSFARFANAFTHIFAGGYAAGYYSYKWAELLSADAFSAFEEEGVFNQQTGLRFRNEILECGGSRDVGEMFESFRGRMPSSEALLKQMGA